MLRLNFIEEEIRRLIAKGTLIVNISGTSVGQINGLAVLDVGGYSFGRPSRVTATVALGQSGVINIEREARMSGSTHDKGIMILSGFLRARFGQTHPLAMTASLCFEQSYSGIDGDSASSTELYALLSALSGVPLRQDLAVTGSVDQHGTVQAIGGVNQKVEGFYRVCKAIGLTGAQGVLVPRTNVPNLTLDPETTGAIERGQFHIYPIDTIDRGIEALHRRARGNDYRSRERLTTWWINGSSGWRTSCAIVHWARLASCRRPAQSPPTRTARRRPSRRAEGPAPSFADEQTRSR